MSVLRSEVLQDLLVVTVVDVIAVDLQDDLARLKTRPCRLPAYSMSTRDQRSKVTVWYNYRGTVYNTLAYYDIKKTLKSAAQVSHILQKQPQNTSIKVHEFTFSGCLLIISSVQNVTPFVPPGK